MQPERQHHRSKKHQKDCRDAVLDRFAEGMELLVEGMPGFGPAADCAGYENGDEPIALGELDKTVGEKNARQRNDAGLRAGERVAGRHGKQEPPQQPSECRAQHGAERNPVATSHTIHSASHCDGSPPAAAI